MDCWKNAKGYAMRRAVAVVLTELPSCMKYFVYSLVCLWTPWLHSDTISYNTPECQVGSSHHLITHISLVPRFFMSTSYTHFKALFSVSIYQVKSLQQAFVLRNIDFRIKIAHKPNTFLHPTLLEGVWATITAGGRFTCWKTHHLFSSLKDMEYFVLVFSAEMEST